MASKKKKGRGKAKKAEQKQEAAKQMETLDEQMGRLKIEDDSKDEDALLDEAIKLAAAEKENQVGKIFAKKHSNACYHGYVETKDRFIIQDFSEAYFAGFMSSGTGDLGKSVKAARDATNKQYPEVWRNSSKLKQIVSLFLFNAAQHVLEENIKGAQLFAAVAYFFQEYIASCVDKQKAMIHSSKMVELFHTELHTLVKYLKKNIPCNCLDTKYKEVKSITKMGVCRNTNCSLPNRMVERSKMLYCTRCRDANYCSRECQKAAWPFHKKLCKKT